MRSGLSDLGYSGDTQSLLPAPASAVQHPCFSTDPGSEFFPGKARAAVAAVAGPFPVNWIAELEPGMEQLLGVMNGRRN